MCGTRYYQDVVAVPRSTLRMILDCVDRVHSAAQHASRLGSQARDAFDQEAARIADVSLEVRRAMDRF